MDVQEERGEVGEIKRHWGIERGELSKKERWVGREVGEIKRGLPIGLGT